MELIFGHVVKLDLDLVSKHAGVRCLCACFESLLMTVLLLGFDKHLH